ncbi:hypothetical protein ACFL2R_02075 [Patescibacteria group bacterium]
MKKNLFGKDIGYLGAILIFLLFPLVMMFSGVTSQSTAEVTIVSQKEEESGSQKKLKEFVDRSYEGGLSIGEQVVFRNKLKEAFPDMKWEINPRGRMAISTSSYGISVVEFDGGGSILSERNKQYPTNPPNIMLKEDRRLWVAALLSFIFLGLMTWLVVSGRISRKE